MLRYPLGKGAKAPVVGGGLTYGRQQFTVAQTLPNNGADRHPERQLHDDHRRPRSFDIPVTTRSSATSMPGSTRSRAPARSRPPTQYGAATVTGFEIEAGGDYMLTKNIFCAAPVRFETIGFKFKGDPTSQTQHARHRSPTQDVSGANDTYFGGTATVGYLY